MCESLFEREKEINRAGAVLCVSIIYEYSMYHGSTLSMSNHVQHPHVAASFLELQKLSMVSQFCRTSEKHLHKILLLRNFYLLQVGEGIQLE